MSPLGTGVFLFLFVLEILVSAEVSEQEDDVCTTPGCIEAADTIRKNMDPTVDPCDNFYLFACGNFIKTARIPEDKSTVNVPHGIAELLETQLHGMLEEPADPQEPYAFTVAKELYQTCMDTDSIEALGLDALKGYMKRLGGWPVLEGDGWDAGAFDWKQLTYGLHRMGFGSSYLLRVYVFLDPKNSSRTSVFLHQALLGLKREYLSRGTTDTLVMAYYSYMVDLAVMFGAEEAAAVQQLRDSLDFEFQLANISVPKEELRNFSRLYNPVTIGELQRRYPSVPWLEYIGTLLDGARVTAAEPVILQTPEYVRQLERLLRATPRRVQANYMLWRVVESSAAFLSDAPRRRLLRYMRAVSGASAMPPRWRECVAVVSGGLPAAVGALYVRRAFDRRARQEARRMVRDVHAELRAMLRAAAWMDAATRRRALRKLANMRAHIGYPDELLQDAPLARHHAGLRVLRGRYLDTVLAVTRFERRSELAALHAPVNKSAWPDHANAAVVNAFYTFSENSINLPAGILQGAFFARDRPRYLNYGAVGTVIGHEMIHGYDDKGRQYDELGDLRDWWAPATERAFERRALCFVRQYAAIRDPQTGQRLDGANTQGENIADHGGARAAYGAYLRYERGLLAAGARRAEPRLPGLPRRPPRQLFWLALAGAFCTRSRPQYERLAVATDEHAPAMFRVLGALSNLPAFAADFGCAPGTAMNPRRKCRLW